MGRHGLPLIVGLAGRLPACTRGHRSHRPAWLRSVGCRPGSAVSAFLSRTAPRTARCRRRPSAPAACRCGRSGLRAGSAYADGALQPRRCGPPPYGSATLPSPPGWLLWQQIAVCDTLPACPPEAAEAAAGSLPALLPVCPCRGARRPGLGCRPHRDVSRLCGPAGAAADGTHMPPCRRKHGGGCPTAGLPAVYLQTDSRPGRLSGVRRTLSLWGPVGVRVRPVAVRPPGDEPAPRRSSLPPPHAPHRTGRHGRAAAGRGRLAAAAQPRGAAVPALHADGPVAVGAPDDVDLMLSGVPTLPACVSSPVSCSPCL